MSEAGVDRDGSGGGTEVAFILLLIQVGTALLTAGGGFFLLVFAPGFRGIGVLAGIELGVSLALLLLAAGVLRRRPRALVWTARLEVGVLLGSQLTLLAGQGVSFTLSFAVAQVLLPAAVLALVLRTGGRAGAPAGG